MGYNSGSANLSTKDKVIDARSEDAQTTFDFGSLAQQLAQLRQDNALLASLLRHAPIALLAYDWTAKQVLLASDRFIELMVTTSWHTHDPLEFFASSDTRQEIRRKIERGLPVADKEICLRGRDQEQHVVMLEHIFSEGKQLVLFGFQPIQHDPSAGLKEFADTAGLDSLSGRERQILRLMADHKKNAEIAKELNLTIGTVKNYISEMYQKLGVSRRSEAVVIAQSFPHPH